MDGKIFFLYQSPPTFVYLESGWVSGSIPLRIGRLTEIWCSSGVRMLRFFSALWRTAARSVKPSLTWYPLVELASALIPHSARSCIPSSQSLTNKDEPPVWMFEQTQSGLDLFCFGIKHQQFMQSILSHSHAKGIPTLVLPSSFFVLPYLPTTNPPNHWTFSFRNSGLLQWCVLLVFLLFLRAQSSAHCLRFEGLTILPDSFAIVWISSRPSLAATTQLQALTCLILGSFRLDGYISDKKIFLSTHCKLKIRHLKEELGTGSD